jgi:hypothetical protein
VPTREFLENFHKKGGENMKTSAYGWAVAGVGACVGVALMWITKQIWLGFVLVFAAGGLGEYLYIKGKKE